MARNESKTKKKKVFILCVCFHLSSSSIRFCTIQSYSQLSVEIFNKSCCQVSRLINVQWLGTAVDNSFRVFVDDRDQGPVVLTHMYLLVGMSLPLWLTQKVVGELCYIQPTHYTHVPIGRDVFAAVADAESCW